MTTRPSPVERKVAAVLGLTVADVVDASVVAATVEDDLRHFVVGAVVDPARGIDRIEHEVDGRDHFFLGHAGPTLRLLVGIVVHERDKTAEITLRATKADRDALDDTDWGDSGPNVGNSVLVARVFHVGLFALRRSGVVALVNHPFDARVRARYTAMGFDRGERLDLTSNPALGTAFAFIGRVYGDHGLVLDALPP